MADIDLKTETPDTTLPTTGFLFGADSQSAASPSVFTVQSVATTLLGSTTLTGATVTTSSPVIDAAQTWNASGTTFTGLKFNATDTASDAGSLLMDLQVGGASRFSVGKGGVATLQGALTLVNSNTRIQHVNNAVLDIYANNAIGIRLTGQLLATGALQIGNVGNVTDLELGRLAAANLRLGGFQTSASATITVTIASPGVVTWANHNLSVGTPVIFTTTGALPTGITADTTYYAIPVNANTFQIATSFANALAGTAVNTSGSQSGTHTGRRGAIAQQFGPQDTLSVSSSENIDGADFVIRGSRSIGNKPGGSIIFQFAAAGTTGTAQNALANAFSFARVSDGGARLNLITTNSTLSMTAVGNSFSVISSSFDVVFPGARFRRSGVGYGLAIGSSSADAGGGTGNCAWLFGAGEEANHTLAQRNGANAQAFRLYNTFTSATNFERANFFWDSNVLKIGTEKGSAGGTARALEFQTDGTTRLTIGTTGAFNFGGVSVSFASVVNFGNFRGAIGPGLLNGANAAIVSASGKSLEIVSDNTSGRGIIIATSTGNVQFGGTTDAFPALKRSSTTLQVRLADDTDFGSIQGKLTTETAYTAGAPTATGYLVLYDSTGTAYKIPAEAV